MSPFDCLKFNTHPHQSPFFSFPDYYLAICIHSFPVVQITNIQITLDISLFSHLTCNLSTYPGSSFFEIFPESNYFSLINQQGPWIKPSLSELLQQLRSLCLFAPVYSPHSSQCNCLNFKSWWIFPLLRISKGITMQKALYDLAATPSLTSFLITCFLNPSAIISSFEVTLSLCEVHSP